MTYHNLLVDVKDRKMKITINRPDVRNALDPLTINEIRLAFEEAGQNPEVSVVIITGAGEKSFASGADIRSLRDRTMLETLLPGMQGLTSYIDSFDKPVIAAVNGYALGGGCEITLACDLCIAAENAKFGLPELTLGVIPGAGGTQRLAQLVGKRKAKELIFTGEILSAIEAEDLGLVNKVVPLENLIITAEEMADRMLQKGPLALRFAKQSINAGYELSQSYGLKVEKLSQAALMTSDDKYEGTSAFLEKRKPNFKGK
ncbi:enoyl-CoA hydratase/isomerase family protein [Neobacillus niacini]|uniref:enoyl-CoA hydratase/isomerase family protein n=1 Tax=Neobacillus niacini TaxID=86668 RepID=UPI0039833CF6